MFEPTAGELGALGLRPAWTSQQPGRGEPGYEAYLAYEDQQIAFWNAWAAGESSVALPDGSPNFNAGRSDAGLLAEIGRGRAAENAAAGRTLRAIADYALRQIAQPEVGYDEAMMMRSVEAEVGLMLRMAPSSAAYELHLALDLRRRLPRTLAALEAGDLTKVAARILVEESANLDVAQCARLEAAVLPGAADRSPRSLRDKTRKVVELLDADAVRKRKEQATADRCVYVRDEHDGMATLCLYGPAGVVRSLYDALNDKVLSAQASARAAAGNKGATTELRDDRRVGAQRFDTIVDLLGAGLGTDPWAPPAPESSFLTPEQIAALDAHAGTYRPSEAMKRAVRNRDKHCRFPGCRRPAKFCDVDHSIAFVKVGGKLLGPGTVYFNLGCLCRRHHQVKQMPGWHLEQDRGRFIWTAPNGMRFIVHPPPDDPDDPEADEQSDFSRYDGPVPF
jgi:hypothetical protein